ncbi:MAG: hypothetical protein KIT17_01915 [Rubrivivax sp.]|nr:hypothetical protein [Rubrivivax sp.]
MKYAFQGQGHCQDLTDLRDQGTGYDTQAWLPKSLVIVNEAGFDALDAPSKAAVLKAAADAEVRGVAASKKANGDSLDRLKAGGMQILPPPAALKGDMQKVGQAMLKEWLDKAGPEGKPLVDAFMKRAVQGEPEQSGAGARPARRPHRRTGGLSLA